MKTTSRATTLREAADLIERRLVATASCSRRPPETLSEHDRGVMLALRTCQALLREAADA